MRSTIIRYNTICSSFRNQPSETYGKRHRKFSTKGRILDKGWTDRPKVAKIRYKELGVL